MVNFVGGMKVGIPRALLYWQYFPAWKEFFEELGAEVVVSGKTNKSILAQGSSRLVGDICLPVKVFCGHALSLVRKCDFLFIPSIHSLKQGIYNCPKFIGLPDIIRANVPEAPPILDPDINLSQDRRLFYEQIYRLGRVFTPNPLKIKRAFEKALNTLKNHPLAVQDDDPLPHQESTSIVALVGHPYLLEDDYVNMGIKWLLRRRGARVLLGDRISQEEQEIGMRFVVKQPYWTYEGEVIGAGAHFLNKKDVDGVILLVAFGCGPDSLMMEMLKSYAQKIGKPFMTLILEEHSSPTGLITRLEAFLDMLKRRKPTFQIPTFIKEKEEIDRIRVFGVPRMGEKFSVFTRLCEEVGVKLLMPPVTQRTISLGTRYSPEFVCLPFKAILGTFIECLEQGADTLFMVKSSNACRMGYYLNVQEQILSQLNYKFKFFQFHSKNKGIIGILRAIKQFAPSLSWSKVLHLFHLGVLKLKAIEEIELMVKKLLPLEIERGKAKRIYQEAIRDIDQAMDPARIRMVLEEYKERLRSIPIKEGFCPLKVGIVGEIYVIVEPFVNFNIEDELGRLGVEVIRPPSSYYSRWLEWRSFMNALGKEKERLSKLAHPYLKRDVGGHGLESVGEKVKWAGKIDGLIHLMPFTCMPEIIAQNVMEKIKDPPTLTIICDELQGKAGLLSRLEAFVDLLNFRRASKSSGAYQ